MNNRIFKAMAVVTVVSVTTRILSFAFKIWLSRVIGAEGLGVYQIALSIFFMLATITASGLPLTLSRKTAELRTLYDSKSEFGLLTSCLIIGLGVSVVITAFFFVFQSYIGFMFSDNRALSLFLILLPALVSSTVYCIIRGWFMGRKEFLVYSISELFECVIRIALGIIMINGLIWGISGTAGAAWSFMISDVICGIIMVIIFFTKKGKLSRPGGFRKIAPNVASVTGVRLYTSVISSLIAVILPAQLIASGVAQGAAVAEYGRVAGMTLPLIFAPLALTGSLATVLLPEAAGDKAGGQIAALSRKIEKSLLMSVIFACLFLSVYMPLGNEIGILLYNDAEVGKYIYMSAFIMIPLSINQITGSLINSLGHEGRTLGNYVIGTLFLLSCLFVLPRYIGSFALIVGLGGCYIITCVLNIVLLRRYTQFKITFMPAMLAGTCIAVTATFVCSLVKALMPASEIIKIIICLVISLGMFGFFIVGLNFINIYGMIKLRAKKKKTPLKPAPACPDGTGRTSAAGKPEILSGGQTASRKVA